ncbi:MAG: COG4223 family protein [Bacillota bacterium]
MNGTRTGMGWGARLLVGLVLILAGAAAAVWALGHYQPAARFLGIVPAQPPVMLTPKPVIMNPQPQVPAPQQADAQEAQKIADLEGRLARVETATARAEGSAGRADALVVAFAARRAIDRGVALGYLENLLMDRFGAQHRAAVATVITASHQPVRLDDLITQYDTLGPELRRGGPQDSWWTNFRRELGNLVEVHSASRPGTSPEAQYARARQRLAAGDVDQALAETMRLPGASRAGDWIGKARRYIAAHRALDEIESAALMPSPNAPA